MKNLFKILALVFTGLLVFSCEKDEDQAVVNETSAGKISADKSAIVLNELNANDAVITFTWTKPTFNIAVVPNQKVEFGIKGDGFKKSAAIDFSNDMTSGAITHAAMNAAMFSIGAVPDVVNDIEVRLKTSVGPATFYSNVIAIKVTPYTPNPDLVYPKINVPGAYAGAAGYANWTPANSPNLFSPEKNDKYRGFIFIKDASGDNGKYKFAINQDWPGNKGDDGTNTGKLKADGSDIVPSAAGTFYMKVDWAANTYSAVLANFGIIGDATPTGWNSDTDFVYNPATKTYVINSIALSNTGVFKFRANDDWAMKFQPKDADQTLVSGTAVQSYFSAENTVTGDPAYKVSQAGNYKIELDLHNSAYYKLTITKL
ncbi:SusE domain-containing protein [Chryseobacterium sediminis]|uniref:SusF/SusE family outer membrane protein n=1 Tax=Chryseobacterium sediminis TaxID=1679494 RepID=A0A5B2U222_9FLAO|nr:SusE domain-containing protein [Chryseobacterium sediminis]KAA2220599.1 SusF/SusE family outer membrane protein [Chryseobacterium sediminis]